MGSKKREWGFSIIEVLVCVALIGLLTAVAIPNFVRVQTQATVAQAKADLAGLKSGLEAYKVDLGEYILATGSNSCLVPFGDYRNGFQPTFERLTTPVMYVRDTVQFRDAFLPTGLYTGVSFNTLERPPEGSIPAESLKHYYYHARNIKDSAVWDQPEADEVKTVWYILESSGPDQNHHMMYQILNQMTHDTSINRARVAMAFYDPTNGTMSRGSIWELGGEPQGTGTSMAFMINAANGSGVGDWERYGE